MRLKKIYMLLTSIFSLLTIYEVIIVVLGIFCSFVLKLILSGVFGYVDESNAYISNIFISLKVGKPIIYLILGILSYLEYKNMKI